MKKWLILLVLLVGCSLIAKPSYELTFSIADTGKVIDGNVYLNGNFLGRTDNGWLGVALANMTAGKLNFAGYYQSRPFNFSYTIGQEQLDKRYLKFSVDKSSLETFTMDFPVTGTSEHIDGTVTNNDIFLGRTVNGKLEVPFNQMREGRIAINGTYGGKPFEFKFSVDENTLKNPETSFGITKTQLDEELFNAEDLNRQQIEREIVGLVNVERDKVGTPHLKWNSNAAAVAYGHSLDMAQRDYFAHETPEGSDAGARLKQSGVFYMVAAEDLSLFENVRSDTNLSKESVDGWMHSPGHRAPIIDTDKLFSDAGAGVVCTQKTCYVTLVFVGNERDQSAQLPSKYLTFYYLYDPNFGFTMPVPVRVQVKSDSPINAYFVSSRKQYDQLVSGQPTDYLERFEDKTSIDEEFTVTPGMGLVLENKGTDAQVSIHFDYYP